jgi:hypothetical protein
VATVHLSADFCDATTCGAFRDGQLVYRDESHLTTG